MIVDLYLVYSFIKRLATPFNKWDAYKLGIIDADGNILKKRKEFTTPQEKKAFGIFDLMILKLKKLLAKVPGGSTRIASYAAALYLIKEWNHFSDSSTLTESVSETDINESLDLFLERYFYYTTLSESVNQKIDEDGEGGAVGAPTNSVGSGAVAGLGGINGEPGVPRSAQLRHIKKNGMTRRKLPSEFMFKEAMATMSDRLAAEPGEGGMPGGNVSNNTEKSTGIRSISRRFKRDIKHPKPTTELT